MPSVGVCIMAHPVRQSRAEQLVYRLEDHGVSIVWDTTNTVWDTGRQAWLAGIGSPYTHWMVIQDDALVCRDLIPGVEQALRYTSPSSPLSLYVGQSRPFADYVESLVQKAENSQASFITTNKINWGVGIVVPTVQIAAMIDYCDRRSDKMYDRRLGKWFLHQGIRVWHTWPSLVDHRNGPSVLGHRREDRRAHRFIGEYGSALDVDWSQSVVHVPKSTSRRVP